MRVNDEKTAEYIQDLETLLDLVTAERDEYREENKVLREAVKRWKTTRRFEVA